MSHPMRRSTLKHGCYMVVGTTFLFHLSGLAAAQQEAGTLEEILVTGTLIRGAQAIGSQTIGINADDVIETGAVTTNELLATVPQVSNFFNQRPEMDPRVADRNTVNRPNLRALPGINSASGATTLVLVDSHRLTPVGVNESSVDPDIIPGNVIERVDIVPDGGSSLYGADAVGGVINFLTLNEFEGVKVDLGYDTGDDYDAWQISFLAGTSWDSGNAYISLTTTDREDVLNGDRDWAAQGLWNEDGTVLTPDGTECVVPAGSKKTWFWVGTVGGTPLNIWTDSPSAPGTGVFPVGEPCDISAQGTLLPEQQRDNVYGSISQNFGDGIDLDVKAYYMDRSTSYASYPLGDSITGETPTDLGVVGEETGDLYDQPAVGFSYAPNAAYWHREREVEIETWGITPELTIKFGNSWQSRNTLHFGRSENTVVQPDSNRSKLLDYVESGEVDPLNISAADAAVIRDILNWEVASETEQQLFFIRSIADGELLDLPSGVLRAAVGVEYAEDDAKRRKDNVTIGGLDNIDWKRGDRDVKSVFGELSVPVLATLDVSLSVRYDDYSDFGDTTNPQVGISWQPADWIEIYGKWGESFNAPTLLDSIGTAIGGFYPNQASVVPDPNMERTDPTRNDSFLLEGAGGELDPQTAEIWAAGFVVEPLEGLRLNFNYYDIDFVDLLGSVDPTSATAVQQNPDKIVFEPTDEELAAFIAAVDNSDQFADLRADTMGVIVDRRQSNTDEAQLEGFDFGAQYFHDTRYGQMFYNISGTKTTTFDIVKNNFATDQLLFNPDLALSGIIGWSRHNVRARLTLNYTNGSNADPAETVNQGSVDDFLATNLFVGYDFDTTSGLTEGLSLRLNVDNIFDEDPPEYRRQQSPSYRGFTLGRVFKFGLTKRF